MPYRITENCKGCGHCVQWCPVRAIKGQRRVGYRAEASRCIACGVCGRICAYSAVLTPDGASAVRLRVVFEGAGGDSSGRLGLKVHELGAQSCLTLSDP